MVERVQELLGVVRRSSISLPSDSSWPVDPAVDRLHQRLAIAAVAQLELQDLAADVLSHEVAAALPR